MEIFEFKIGNNEYKCLYEQISLGHPLKTGIIIKEIPIMRFISNHIENISYKLYTEIFFEFELEELVWFEWLDYGIQQKISKVEFGIYNKEHFLDPKWTEIKDLNLTSPRKFNLKIQEYLKSESNIVKDTTKELGMTQKQLSEYIGVHENTVSGWSRGTVEIPQMAIKLLELLKIEKRYNSAKQLFCDSETK